MKKVLLLLFLSMVVTANAGVVIYVDKGDGLWANYADSKLYINPSDEITFGIFDSGQTQPGSLALGITMGPGSLDVSGMVTSQGVTAMMQDDAMAAAGFGLQNPFISMEITGPTQSGGILVDKVVFHCDGPGDVTFAIVDEDGNLLDAQVIHQPVPEPMTLALLGLGGLFLRRRIA